jgi:oligoendopeptidase F
MTMCAVETLPRWDMTVVFPGLDSPEFDREFRSVIEGIDALSQLFDRLGIGRLEVTGNGPEITRAFDEATAQYADLVERLSTLSAYISAFVATDSRNDLAQARMSELQQHLVLLSQLDTRYVAWIGSLDISALERTSDIAREHAYMLEKARVGAQHLMSQAEEDLAAEMEVTGGDAWSKLHTNVTSQLMVPITLRGEPQQLPMAVVRNLALDPDRDVRRAGYEAEIAAWKGVAVPLAAALNGIKGESNTLNSRRRWPSALDVALFNNNIDRNTLDAMMEAATKSFPDFRRYLRAKARLLGVPALTWYDISAPVGGSSRTWQFDEAVEFLLDQFGAYSPGLREFAARAFRERWIDAEPREGKRGGAFCMRLRRDESRVLANFVPSYGGMSTLAHELGHAYHNYNLAGRTTFQRATPMTLAETASIFCETIVQEAALERADEQEQVAILEAALENACQIVVDISSRFIFERSVCEDRSRRELSVDELNVLMIDSQKETYGDGLDHDVLHPYMWAAKGHYYSAGRPYYNFPYMFGLLFGLGLYARYTDDPNDFRQRYDALLSSTGLADTASVASQFGIDVRTSDFWTASLDIIRRDIERFEGLVDSRGA